MKNESSATDTQEGSDSYDAIAELLVDEVSDEQDTKTDTESDTGDDGAADSDSTGDDTGTGDAGDGAEQQDGDNDLTWGAALGLEDSKVVLDEESGALKGIMVKVGDDVSVVDIPTLVKGYQTDKYNTQRSQQIAAERKEVEERTAIVVETYTKKLDDAAKLTELLHNNLTKDFRNINWEALRVQNPAEYAALRQEYSERSNQLNDIYTAIENQREKEAQEFSVQREEQRQMYVRSQIERIIENNPDWASPEAFKSKIDEVTSFFNTAYGIEPELLMNLADYRIIEVFKDAKKGREGTKIATGKIPKAIPKFMKPKGVGAKPVSNVDKLAKAAKSAVGAKKRDLESSAIAALLLGEQ